MKTKPKDKPAKGPWRCPKCGREFAQRLAFHSCGNFTLEGYLEAKNPSGVALFQTLTQTAQGLGQITLSPAKTQVSFRGARTTFMMVFIAGKRVGGYLFLRRSIASPIFRKVHAASANRHVHHFQFDNPKVIQGEFAQYLREAIAQAGPEDDESETKTKTGKEAPIGEQINQLYRTVRA